MAAHPSINRWRFDARLARRCGIAGVSQVIIVSAVARGEVSSNMIREYRHSVYGSLLAEACSELLRTSRVFGP